MNKIGIVISASAVVAVAGAGTFFPTSGFATLPYTPTAAIDTSNTTVGFADSNIYGMTPADIDRTLDSMQAMGVNDVRILLPWAFIEPWPGVDDYSITDYLVNAADERGMGILGVLNSTPSWATEPGQPQFSSPPASDAAFAEFASTMATRYAGKISAYEVWNEPNTVFFYTPKPDAADYTRMLQAVYPAIKAADPNATVVGGVLISIVDYGDLGVNPINYLSQMYAAGAQGSFDALSFHPYQFTLPFSQGAIFGDAAPIVQMDKMHQLMVANGDGDKLIWSTEYGTPTSVVDENTQAAMIQDYLSSWSQLDYAGPSFIYTTRDINTASTNPDDTFGVLRDDWTWKPAAYVIQQWTATHPQQPVPTDLMAAMTSLDPNTPVAVDSASGALTTIDPTTGQPVAVASLVRSTASRMPRAPADAAVLPEADPTLLPVPTAGPSVLTTTARAAAPAAAPAAEPAATASTPAMPPETSPTGAAGAAPSVVTAPVPEVAAKPPAPSGATNGSTTRSDEASPSGTQSNSTPRSGSAPRSNRNERHDERTRGTSAPEAAESPQQRKAS